LLMVKNTFLIRFVLCLIILVAPYTAFGTLNAFQDLMRQKNWKIALAIKGELFYLTPGGHCEHLLETNKMKQSMLNYPTYSPDCKKIAFSRHGKYGDRLVIHDFSNNTEKIILESSMGIRNLSWSPDGINILFLTKFDRERETFDLSIINCETRIVTSLTKGLVNAISVCTPSWSSNSEGIIFSGINGKIIKVNVDKKEVQFLFDGVCPTYSPDGKKIIYRKGKHHLKKMGSNIEYVMTGFKYYLYNTDTKQENYLFNGRKTFGLFGVETWQSVVWSPNGEYILFFKTYDIPSEEHIFIMDVATRKESLLAKVKPFSSGAISWVDCSETQTQKLR